MIEIKSFGSDEVLESHKFNGSIASFLDFMQVGDWRSAKVHRVMIAVNGKDVYSHEWETTIVSENDLIEIVFIPEGGVIKSVGKLFGSVLDFAFGWLLPSGSRARGQNRYNTPQGERLELSELKANSTRLGQVVPEIFGRHLRYFDYANEPRRYFVDKRQQEVSAVLVVGQGYHDVEPRKVGETPLLDMDNSSSTVFEPNQKLDGYTENWHTVPEVGATSSGTAGLDLSMEVVFREDSNDEVPDGGYIFNGNTITRADGTSFREELQVGDKIVVTLPMTYTHTKENIQVTSNDSVTSTAASGFFGHTLPNITPTNGLQYLFHNNDGDAKVAWYTRRWNQPHGYYTYHGVLLSPRNGQTTSTYGADIEWTVTDIGGDTITVASDNKFFPENYTSTSARIKYVVSSETTRSYPTNTFIATPEKVKTKFIEIDMFFPQGLCYMNDNGSLGFEIAEVEATITDSDNPSFGIVHRFTYRENTNDQIGFTEPIELPYEMRPSVQLRRVGRINNSVQSHSLITWFGLKSRLPDIERYPNWTTIGVTLQTGGKIAAQSENRVNAIVTRKLQTLNDDGSWSYDIEPTRDIASVVKYIANTIGYKDDDLDMEEILRLHTQYWKPRNEYFDYVFDETTVRQAFDMALGAGMSDLTISNGLVKPVRNEKKTVLEQTYSAQNFIGNLDYSARLESSDDFDGVEVEYTDPNTFDRKVIVCSTKESHERIKLMKVPLRGVTDELRAWKIGMRLWLEMLYIRKDFTFKTEMEAFNSEYGSFIGIVNDATNYQQSCLILGVNGHQITLSEKVKGDYDSFSWRKTSGVPTKSYKILSIDENVITVDFKEEDEKPRVTLNRDLPHAYLGVSNKFITKCIVSDITPNGLDNATIKANNYDDRVFMYDNENEVIQ